MLSGTSIIALLATAAFASVIPSIDKNKVENARRNRTFSSFAVQLLNLLMEYHFSFRTITDNRFRELSFYKSSYDNGETQMFFEPND